MARTTKRRKKHRSAYTNIFPQLVLLLAAVFAGLVVKFDPYVLERAYLYLSIAFVSFLIIFALLAFYVWRRQQLKTKALRMVDIDRMSGREFEEYLGVLLKGRGYQNVEVTQVAGDFGADLIATLNDVKYAVQAKRYVGQVGVDALYQCFGGQKYYGCDESMVITNATFTEAAQELAEKSGAILVDGETLAKWIIEFQEN